MNVITKAAAWLKKSFTLRDANAYRAELGYDSAPGARVTHDTAMQLATVWACVRLISETISTLPLITYQRAGEARTVAREHPLYALLHDSPNADMTAVEFWEAVIAQLCLWGNSYCLKSYARGVLVALDPLEPGLMTVKRTRDGDISYVYADPRGQKIYTEDEIWHVKGFGTNGLMGLSPVSYARRSFGAALAADKASSNVFSTGMRPEAIVTMDAILTPDQREKMKGKLMGAVFGDSSSGRMMLLEGGPKYQQLSINPEDAQMLETRTFHIEEMCRWFQVPPSMIGHGGSVSNYGTGREQIMLGFLTFALRPYLTRIEQGIRKSLLSPADRIKYFAEFSLEGLLRADSAARASFYATAAQNGWLTRNEIRALENWAPKDGGDDLTVQSNLIPLTMLGKITSTAGAAKSALLTWLGVKADGEENDET